MQRTRAEVMFVRPSHASMHRDERLARFVERSEPDRVRFLDLARAADVGISGIAVALREHSRRAKLLVTDGSVEFALSDESEGTQLWLDLLPEVIDSSAGGHTLVINEIDTSLHPLLVRKLVAMFRDPAVNVGRVQLLFTTHDAFLLAPLAGGQAGRHRKLIRHHVGERGSYEQPTPVTANGVTMAAEVVRTSRWVIAAGEVGTPATQPRFPVPFGRDCLTGITAARGAVNARTEGVRSQSGGV